ncbi:MAG: hypothetical protein WBA97_08485 [Actinophytocola sp.]|uniref:helix-turn-helix domain-containing protein n=1 Tax=Actinophytocola sp. TaxID=1872138 RepID=UPI003C73E1E0
MERNDRLRAAREATPSLRVPDAHMSRAELAESANGWLTSNTDRPGILDDGYVARLERGRIRWPNADYRAAFRGVLGALSDAELGFRPSGTHRRPVRPLWDERRPDSSSGPSRSDSGHFSESPPDVAAIRAMADAFQAADRRVGGGQMYGTVVRYLRTEIGPRLVDATGPADADLFAAACSLTHIAGWFAHDSGDDAAARNHFGRAYRLASAADHAALAANVCASMSHLAGQLNQAGDAVRIAGVGLDRTAGTSGTTRLVARLHAMRARGLAAQGDRRACTTALDTSEHALTSGQGETPAEWIAGFDEAALASEAALCLRQLGDLAGAEQLARRVIQLRVGDRVRSRAFGKLTLAGVLVDAGRVDEAAVIGTELCQVTEQLTSARVRTKLDRLGSALRPHASVPAVAGFLDALTSITPRKPATDAGWPV